MTEVTEPLPAGFGIAFDPGTQFVGTDVLFGGSPARLMRLNAAGQRALAELRDGAVGSAAAGLLARRLTDAGLAHPRPPAVTGPPDVTVVIPVRDRSAELSRLLAEVAGRYPVIVVDDGSLDAATVTRLCARHGATLLRRPQAGGPGRARNTALAAVTTPLVALLDSDCFGGFAGQDRPAGSAGPAGRSDWIAALAGHFADPLVAAVAPRVVPAADPSTLAGRYLGARGPIDLGPAEARVLPLTRVGYVPTAALLVRRAALTGPPGGRPPGPASLARRGAPEACSPGVSDARGVPRGRPPGPAPVGCFDPALRYGEDVDLIWRLTAAGWRVRYDPAVTVRHAEPAGWRALLTRRFHYGSSAAPLSRRHPGQVPPLVLQPWPALAAGALLAGSPVTALAAYAAGTAQLARLLRGWEVPPRRIVRPMAGSVLQTGLGLGRWSTQYALPLVAAGLAWPGGRTRRTRLTRRLALAALLAGPPLAEWRRTRPDLGPVPFTLGYLADEAAYGAGVYRGAAAERLLAPLLPRLAWRPLAKARR